MSFRFSTQQKVRWVDIDAGCVLNHAVYLTLVEQARYEYFDQLGLLEGSADFSFLLGETTARYLSVGRAGMILTVRLRTTHLGNKSFEQEYEIADGDTLLSIITAKLVWCNSDLSSSPIPDRARAKMAAFDQIPERS